MANLDYGSLYQALQQAQAQAAQDSPYQPLVGATNDVRNLIVGSVPRTKASIGEGILAGLVGGLLSGVSGGLQQNYENQQKQSAADVLLGKTREIPAGMSPSIFNDLSTTRSIFEAQQAKEDEDLNLRKNQLLLGALSNANTPYQQDRIISVAKSLGLAPEGLDVGRPNIASQESIVDEQQSSPSESIFPGQSLEDIRRRMLNEALSQGLPGGAAQQEVNQRLSQYRATIKPSADKIASAREKASSLSELASIGEAAVEGSGETGGALGGLRELASKAYALVSPEETQQRAAQSYFNTIAPEIVKMSRSPGAVSDYETKLYLGSGPSIQNTPEQNRVIINKMKAVADIENEYANFLEAYQNEKGTTAPTKGAPGAEVIWQAYKKDNPLFLKGKEGKLELNTDRPSWQEWLVNKSVGESGVDQSIPEGAVDTGRTFKGSPVYKLPNGDLWVQ